MVAAERQTFPARTDSLPAVCAFVDARCAELGVQPRIALRLRLVAEELFINAVDHGYGGDCDRDVELTVRSSGADIVLVQEDAGRPFDPFASVKPAMASGDPEARPVGGLGLVLVAGLSSRHAYERDGARNRTTVSLAAR